MRSSNLRKLACMMADNGGEGKNIKRVIGLGAGGHSKVVIEILQYDKAYEIIGLLDPNTDLWGTKVGGVPVLGGDEHLDSLREQGVSSVFIGLGSADNTRQRRRLFEKARKEGFEVISAIHPDTVISPSVKLGNGITLMAGAVINAQAQMGDNVIVNTGAIVEHDCVIGDHVHIATGAQLASTVHVEDGAHIGLGASVRQCLRVGENAVIGAGSVVIEDVPAEVVVVGVPARVLRRVDS